MHVLAAISVATLLNYLEEQLQHIPSPSQIQGTTEEIESEEEKSEGEGVEQKVFFTVTDIFLAIQHKRVKLFTFTHQCSTIYSLRS